MKRKTKKMRNNRSRRNRMKRRKSRRYKRRQRGGMQDLTNAYRGITSNISHLGMEYNGVNPPISSFPDPMVQPIGSFGQT